MSQPFIAGPTRTAGRAISLQREPATMHIRPLPWIPARRTDRETATRYRRAGHQLAGASLALTATTWMLAAPAFAATIDLYPGQSFEQAVEGLAAGDTLIVHEGTYNDEGKVSITVKGTADAPVVIRGAEGESRPLIGRQTTRIENTINIEGATHLTITGLEITSNGGDGVNLSGIPSHIVLEDLVIHDIAVGINFRSSMDHITVRLNEIYDTEDTGEGIYVGCHDGSCVVLDSLIERNWIHHTAASLQGDGIEIKKGSHSNVVRDNVVHDTLAPCIIVYGTDGNPPNVVERNVMWNCADAGIQAAADAIIRNNILIPITGGGFTSQDHNGVTPNNLSFVNNTIYGGDPCLRLSSWGDKSGLVFANNAVYCPSGSFSIGSLAGVTVSGNVFTPAPPVFQSNGYVVGRSAAEDLLDPDQLDVYPTADSTLIGAGDAARAPADDFNGTARTATVDAGAYAWTAPDNPGWTVAPGFKGSASTPPPGTPPSVSLSADPSTVAANGSSTLSWSASNADTCTALGDWAGAKPLSGTESTGPLTSSRTYTLECANDSGQRASDTVTITVTADSPTPPPGGGTPPPTTGGSGGGGTVDPALLILAAMLLIQRRRLQLHCSKP